MFDERRVDTSLRGADRFWVVEAFPEKSLQRSARLRPCRSEERSGWTSREGHVTRLTLLLSWTTRGLVLKSF